MLLAVIIDSDTLPGGVPGLGLQKVATHMSIISDGVLDDQSLYHAMIAWADKESRSSFNKDILNTLVDGVIYEPTNEKSVVAVNPHVKESPSVKANWRYVGGQPPRVLHNYLREFASPNTTITTNETVKVLRCYGPSSSHPGHNFFAAWGHSLCESCGAIICKLCTITVEVESNTGEDAIQKRRDKNQTLHLLFIC